MNGFKSGVTHDQLAVSDKDTAMAMMDTIKIKTGLWDGVNGDEYVAPHFCDYKPTGDIFTVKDKMGKPINVKSYVVTSKSLDGSMVKKIRHFMGKCTDCNKTKIVGVVV